MVTSIAITKFNRPALQPNLVARPHLTARLEAGLNRKLILVSAPAGFGKTTLIGEWLSGTKQHATWLQLDGTDNDLTRFLTAIVTALQKIEPAVRQPDYKMLQPVPALILTSVINDIAASAVEFILVLDDYHLITAEPVHQALVFLLDHLPENLHLVIISRADPPLLLGRLRGRGQLTELRQADLTFRPDEAKILVERALGFRMPGHDLAALTTRTEGWIAGLQMAILAMRSISFDQDSDNRQRYSQFVQAFSASNRYVMDYLVEEVLLQQPETVQHFLLQTAILDQLTAPLCDAVTGQTNSQTTLELLERSNLFIIALDHERRWYRYHHLFADLLRRRLHQRYQAPADAKESEVVRRLHTRASRWYEQNGFISEAIGHAFSAFDFGYAANLIEQAARPTLMRSEISTFLGWADRLPADLLSNRPILCFFQVWALLLSGQVDRAQAAFEALAEQPEHSAGQITLLRAFLKLSQGDLTGATNLGRQALATLDKDDLFWRGFSNWIFSTFHLMEAGEISQSSAALADLARLSRESGHLMVTVAVLNQLGALYVRQAKLRQAQETYEEALALATSERGELLPVAGEALMGLGELWREWNHLEQAGQYLQDGIALTDRWREAAAYPGLISLARVRQAQGNPPAANSAMRQARERTAQFDPVSGLGPYVASHQAQLWLLQGDIDRAVQWAVDAGLFLNESGNLTQNSGLNDPAQDDNLVTYHLRKYEYMALSRLLLAQKRPAAALALLDPLLQQMERQGRTGMIIEGLVLKALALRAQDKPDQALIVLEEALSLAAAGGYVRLFVDEDIPLARLLGQRPKNPDAPHINDYVRQLRLAFGLAGTQLPSQAVQPLVEPLSERELDVLRLMVTGLKYKEIAARLHISLNTVRHHVKNLYRKLDVNSRTRAVARAQDLGLL